MELNSLLVKEKLKVLVTGANGFLGSHIARLAVHDCGWDVRLFVLKGTSERVLHEFVGGGEIFYGDILDYESIAEAVAGVKWFFIRRVAS
jgi:nucleoside-diphosphate-sugar epimerase